MRKQTFKSRALCSILSAAIAISGVSASLAGNPSGAAFGTENPPVATIEAKAEATIEALAEVSAPGAEYDGYIVKLNEDAATDTDFRALAESTEEVVNETTVVVDEPKDALKFADTEDIAYIEPNYDVVALDFPQDDPSDPLYTNKADYQWSLKAINAKVAWQRGYRGKDVNIAILDSGINAEHEDFDASRLLTVRNFASGSQPKGDGEDRNGHGAFVSGIISAKINNKSEDSSEGIGMAGITDQANLIVYRVLDSKGNGSLADMIRAYEEILDSPFRIDVLNLSLGHAGESRTENEIIQKFVERGTIVVSAVGNDGKANAANRNALTYPANYENVIGVGSVGKSGKVSDFSTKNKSVDVVAPGESVAGLLNSSHDGYRTNGSGTSFASPVVAAAAIMAKQRDKDINAAGFLTALQQTAEDGGSEGYDTSYGYGALKLDTLLAYLDTSKINIAYDTNGGKAIASTKSVWAGEVLGKLPEPTRAGYTFLGWYSKSSGGSLITAKSFAKGHGTVTIYAHWNKNFKLKFNVNKGKKLAKSKQTKTIAKGTAYGSLPTAKRKGYKFLGWYTKKSGGTKIKKTTKVKVSKTQTLYAHWKKK